MKRRRPHAYRLTNIASGLRGCSSITATMTWSAVTMLTITLLLVLSTSSIIITKAAAESEIDNLNSLDIFQESQKNDSDTATSAESAQREIRQNPLDGFTIPLQLVPHSPDECPLCDSSVYSYCSFKLIHDTCCCDIPGSLIYQKPTLCVYADCSLLYAKSCYEHSLIKTCCCNNP